MKSAPTDAITTVPNPIPVGERYLSKLEIASRFGMTPRTIEHWMARGVIPYLKIGKGRRATVLFKWTDIEAHLKTKTDIEAHLKTNYGVGGG